MILVLKQLGELVLELVFDVVRFPVWWFTSGLKLVATWCWHRFMVARVKASLGIFLRHFFTPMYQDYSLSGRALSLMMRFVLVVAKVVRLTAEASIYLIIFLAWLVLLPAAVVIILSDLGYVR